MHGTVIAERGEAAVLRVLGGLCPPPPSPSHLPALAGAAPELLAANFQPSGIPKGLKYNDNKNYKRAGCRRFSAAHRPGKPRVDSGRAAPGRAEGRGAGPAGRRRRGGGERHRPPGQRGAGAPSGFARLRRHNGATLRAARAPQHPRTPRRGQQPGTAKRRPPGVTFCGRHPSFGDTVPTGTSPRRHSPWGRPTSDGHGHEWLSCSCRASYGISAPGAAPRPAREEWTQQVGTGRVGTSLVPLSCRLPRKKN